MELLQGLPWVLGLRCSQSILLCAALQAELWVLREET